MRRVVGLLALVTVLVAGCEKSRPPLPAAVPAKGTISLPGGQPLRAGRVILHPKPSQKDGRVAVEAFGDVEDGKFTLTTYQPGDGAVPGEYVATISPFNYKSKTGSPTRLPNASQVPQRYQEEATSGWEVEITPSGGEVTLQMK
jgi:hypothetical protein